MRILDPIIVYEKNSPSKTAKEEKSYQKTFKLHIHNKFKQKFEKSLVSMEFDENIGKNKSVDFFKTLEIKKDPSDPSILIYSLTTTNFVGVFQVPKNPKIIVKPKFPNLKLIQMLKYAEPEYVHVFKEIVDSDAEGNDFLEIIINLFLKASELSLIHI